MTVDEIKALVETLRSCGITHYKAGDIELDLGPAPIIEVAKPIIPDEASNEIIHKVVEMTSLLKLDDRDLVDRLFPDHTQYGDAEEPSNEKAG